MKRTSKEIVGEIQILLAELLGATESNQDSAVQTSKKPIPEKENSGCSGGLRLLAKEGYFDQPRSKQEVTAKLMEMGRHYTPALISMNLLNFCKERLFIRLGNQGSYKFVIRK